jgi:hypothetical protein
VIVLASLTEEGRRQRRAQAIQAAKQRDRGGGLEPVDLPQLL